MLIEHIYASILCDYASFWAIRDIPLITLSTSLLCMIFCIIPSKKSALFIWLCFVVAISPLCILSLSNQAIHLYDVYAYISFWAGVTGLLIAVIRITKIRLLRHILSFITAFTLLIPAICLWSYFIITHSWIKSSTILAISQTNFHEAVNYLQLHSSISLCFPFILLIGALIYFIKFCRTGKTFAFASHKHKWLSVIILSFPSLFLVYSCNENLFTDIYTGSRQYLKSYHQYILQKDIRQSQIKVLSSRAENLPASGVYVLVIGESENKLHMGAYGYPRDTTPWLSTIKSHDNVVLFNNAYSCYSQTVQVLTYALSAKNQYNSIPLEKAPSIIEAARAAGYDTVWISNQMQFGVYDTPVSYIASSADKAFWLNNYIGNASGTRIQTSAYDEIVLHGLDELPSSDHALIIIHLMGSHFVYDERYPRNYDVYRDGNGLTNSYDSTILYNDYVLSKIYNTVKTFPHFQALIYFSDHGEGIDDGLTHDAVNFIYPMTYTPMYVIFSQDYMNKHPAIYQALKNHRDAYFTNDLIFNTTISIMGIQIPEIYEPENDITSTTYDDRPERFLTMYGTKRIVDDPREKP